MTRFCNLESRWPTLEGKLNFFLRQTEDNITPTYGACGACCSCGANGAYSVVYSPLHVVLEDLVSPCAAVLVGLRAAAEHIAAGVTAQEGRTGLFTNGLCQMYYIDQNHISRREYLERPVK